MGWRTSACTLLLSLLGSGCAVFTDSAHATSYWTNRSIEDMQERHRNRKLASSAWEESRAANPSASEDFAAGFKDGFADHLYRATSQPPPLPPKRYREIRYQTSAGFRAAEEWLQASAWESTMRRPAGFANWLRGLLRFTAHPKSL